MLAPVPARRSTLPSSWTQSSLNPKSGSGPTPSRSGIRGSSMLLQGSRSHSLPLTVRRALPEHSYGRSPGHTPFARHLQTITLLARLGRQLDTPFGSRPLTRSSFFSNLATRLSLYLGSLPSAAAVEAKASASTASASAARRKNDPR